MIQRGDDGGGKVNWHGSESDRDGRSHPGLVRTDLKAGGRVEDQDKLWTRPPGARKETTKKSILFILKSFHAIIFMLLI